MSLLGIAIKFKLDFKAKHKSLHSLCEKEWVDIITVFLEVDQEASSWSQNANALAVNKFVISFVINFFPSL